MIGFYSIKGKKWIKFPFNIQIKLIDLMLNHLNDNLFKKFSVDQKYQNKMDKQWQWSADDDDNNGGVCFHFGINNNFLSFISKLLQSLNDDLIRKQTNTTTD